MDLKGAEIRNIIDLCKDIGGKGEERRKWRMEMGGKGRAKERRQ